MVKYEPQNSCDPCGAKSINTIRDEQIHLKKVTKDYTSTQINQIGWLVARVTVEMN